MSSVYVGIISNSLSESLTAVYNLHTVKQLLCCEKQSKRIFYPYNFKQYVRKKLFEILWVFTILFYFAQVNIIQERLRLAQKKFWPLKMFSPNKLKTSEKEKEKSSKKKNSTLLSIFWLLTSFSNFPSPSLHRQSLRKADSATDSSI